MPPLPILLKLLRGIGRDRSGNALWLIAAALAPLLAMVGGGIDMGRSYLVQSRLQQACDAGVLAARKRLGAAAAVTGVIPDDVETAGNRFFNINFRSDSYGTTDRDFSMTIEDDNSLTGAASVAVPTTIMKIFGFADIDVNVSCRSRLNIQNSDIMMVLDTTGSMADVLSGDTESKLESLRSVVASFHAQVEAAKPAGARIRYGFVPYSSTVNVGWLLQSGWMVDNWTYQGREAFDTGRVEPATIQNLAVAVISGTSVTDTAYVGGICPANTLTTSTLSTVRNRDGSVVKTYLKNGTTNACKFLASGKVEVTPTIYTNYKYSETRTTSGVVDRAVFSWHYKPLSYDVSGLKGASDSAGMLGGSLTVPMGGTPDAPSDVTSFFRGCIEERSTYEITDYADVDFSRALDLDIDAVPTAGNEDTQWRPMFHEISYVRALTWTGRSSVSVASVDSGLDFVNSNAFPGGAACPSPAKKLQAMTATEMSDYLDTLRAEGATYHDIGMIWGGRLLSPTGLFASDNADIPGNPTRRNLIFLTDGLTSPLDISYSAYGIEALDQRRWSSSSSLTLAQVVENRFTVACDEVKKRNVTVWVIGFGQSLNPVLTQCAGEGHSFFAADADDLNEVFSKIARDIGDLRLSQ